jgi:hypothetical protein
MQARSAQSPKAPETKRKAPRGLLLFGTHTVERWDRFEGGVPRAVRFAIEVPVRYRAVGSREWSTGRSANISRSGVLLRGERPLQPQTALELIVRLPFKILGEKAANLRCSGKVVRVQSGEGGGTLAATIASFRFVRGDAEN